MRKAFSLITAIFVMVLMSTLSLLVFNISGKMTKTTTAQYQREQAALLAKSYTELSIMAVMNHDRSVGHCIKIIVGSVQGIAQGSAPSGSTYKGSAYQAKAVIHYLGNDLPCSRIVKLNDSTILGRSTTRIATSYNMPSDADAIAAVIIDVYIRYRDPSQVDAFLANGGTASQIPTNIPWVTFHRRTLQKI